MEEVVEQVAHVVLVARRGGPGAALLDSADHGVGSRGRRRRSVGSEFAFVHVRHARPRAWRRGLKKRDTGRRHRIAVMAGGQRSRDGRSRGGAVPAKRAPAAGHPGHRATPRSCFSRVRFRRRSAAEAAAPVRRALLADRLGSGEPYVSQVVPHPSRERRLPARRRRAAAGRRRSRAWGSGCSRSSWRAAGRVCGVQFRPGGFRPFLAARGTGHRCGADGAAAAARRGLR